MNPYPEMFAAFFTCTGPVVMAMVGALAIGCFIGWLYGPGPADGSPAMKRAQNELRERLAASEEKLVMSGSLMVKRLKDQEDLAMATRQAMDKEITALKMALVAAKRTLPLKLESPARTVEKVVPDPTHVSRIIQLQKENARIPSLLKEVNDLRDLIAHEEIKAPLPAASTPRVLLKNTYRTASTSFGKKIAKDDLKLVEGIGPKIEAQFRKNGLKTWADVAAAKPEQLKKVLVKAGDHYQLHDPSSWPEQCRMMVEDRWEELRKYQRKLSSVR